MRLVNGDQSMSNKLHEIEAIDIHGHYGQYTDGKSKLGD